MIDNWLIDNPDESHEVYEQKSNEIMNGWKWNEWMTGSMNELNEYEWL